MSTSQRWFLVSSLFLLAVGLALYCLDYRVVSADSFEGRLLVTLSNTPEAQREHLKAEFENSSETRGAIPLISFGESRPKAVSSSRLVKDTSKRVPTIDEILGPRPNQVPTTEDVLGPRPVAPTFSGIYARAGLDPVEAVIGGILAPALLLIVAGYLALGARTNAPTKRGKLARTESHPDDPPRQIEQEREGSLRRSRKWGHMQLFQRDAARPGKPFLAITVALYVLVVLVSAAWLAVNPYAAVPALTALIVVPPVLCFGVIVVGFTFSFWGLVVGTPSVSISYGWTAMWRNWRTILGAACGIAALRAAALMIAYSISN
jgi:hypothetical protein